MPTQTHRAHNFYAGPATLPLPALERAQAELLDFAGTGMSVMELSHRSKPYMAVQAEAEALVRRLLGVPDGYRVLFLQGGASLQFGMVPLNLLPEGGRADYVLTGYWAKKALADAKLVGATRVVATGEETNFDRIPADVAVDPQASYFHITSNNTIHGTQFQDFPETGAVPLVADMSSDLMWRPIDVSRFGLIYAGAQKNLGPSGVTLVIIRDDLVPARREGLPVMLRYSTHVEADSMYNTPPTFAIYMLRNVLAWVEDQGGLGAMEARNRRKAEAVYGAIDRSEGYYRGHAQKASRSAMNVTWRLPDEGLEKAFVKEAEASGLVGLAGHRLVGGCRASLYNALPEESALALAAFMDDFARRNG